MLIATGVCDGADNKGVFASGTQNIQGIVFFTSWNRNHHAHTAVKGAIHFAHVYVAAFLQPLEYGREGPALGIQNSLGTFRQYAWDVFSQAAASDVRHGVYLRFFDHSKHGFYVDAGWFHQCIAQWAAATILG